MSKFRYFGHFTVFTGFPSVLFTCSLQVFLDVWRKWASKVWATLGSKMSKNSSLWPFSTQFFTGFASFLVYMSIWTSFRRTALSIVFKGPIAEIFGSQNQTWFRSLVIFSNIFHWFHIFLVLHAYWMYVYLYFNAYFRWEWRLLSLQASCSILKCYKLANLRCEMIFIDKNKIGLNGHLNIKTDLICVVFGELA